MDGIVFSIEEFSVHDGPGIRSTVFLKGCPLCCSWCHNPEGQLAAPQILRSPNGCAQCGNCLRYSDERGFTRQSIDHCPRGLLRVSGERIGPEELCRRLLKNSRILNRGGGVTFSGGEPFLQPEFLFSCLRLLDGKLHRAIQTSGFCPADTFEQGLALCDYVLYDLKLMDPAQHKYHTGADNQRILENYRILAASGKEFVTRIPLIPGVTDTPENLEAAAEFVAECGIFYVELLPYNPMAGGKYALVGRKYAPTFDPAVPWDPHPDVFEARGIRIKIM